MVLPGVSAPEAIKSVYSQREAYAIVVDHHLKQADDLLKNPGMPHYAGVQSQLKQAAEYAVTPETLRAVQIRQNNLSLMPLLYQADVAAQPGPKQDLKAAQRYLEDALRLPLDPSQKIFVEEKLARVQHQGTPSPGAQK